jgi:hypothetical protein
VTPFSARYAAAIAAAIALLLVPATLRQRVVEDRSECTSETALLSPSRFDPESQLVTEGERPSRLDRGRLVATVADSEEKLLLVYSVVRMRGLAHGLLEPASILPGTIEPDRLERRLLETSEGPIPVTYAFEHRRNDLRTTAYLMTYDGRAVENPFWTRIRASLDSLRNGPLPITLFVVSTQTHRSQQTRAEARLERWLENAWRVYRTDCHGAPPE